MTPSSYHAWSSAMDDLSRIIGRIEEAQDNLKETIDKVQHESKNRTQQLLALADTMNKVRDDVSRMTARMDDVETKMNAVDKIWQQFKGARTAVYVMVAGVTSVLTLFGKWFLIKLGIIGS
jgi:conjugal transfer/entry exclusion protein